MFSPCVRLEPCKDEPGESEEELSACAGAGPDAQQRSASPSVVAGDQNFKVTWLKQVISSEFAPAHCDLRKSDLKSCCAH